MTETATAPTPTAAPAVDERPAEAAAPAAEVVRDLEDPSLYFNRELSWLEFNRRVLEEALDPRNPLLERVKFLAIFSSNLDEFFMIRVSGLRRQLSTGVVAAPADGMTPAEQLAAIRDRLGPVLAQAARCWDDELRPELEAAGVHIKPYDDLSPRQQELLRGYFRSEIFPALTPLAFDPGHPFPHISNLSINLALVVDHPGQGERFARLKVPQIFPRLLRIPVDPEDGADAQAFDHRGLEDAAVVTLVFLEEVIAANLDLLFPEIEIVAVFPFRVTRDADFEIEEDEASDLLAALEEVVGQRHFGFAVRLEVDTHMPDTMRDILLENLELQPYQAFAVDGPIGKSDLIELIKLDRPELKDPPFQPVVPPTVLAEETIWAAIQKRDILLHHPYDSFTPVVDFIRQAARDPDVLAIKQTLYRVGPDSPVVEALMDARENGKQVAVLVELKARFDETNNIVWARALERAGVHVVYGVLGLKTHAKMSLVVRRERAGIIGYVHLGTGNYNPVTSKIYTDVGLLTCDEDIAADVADLFNSLTGYSRKHTYRKLLVAPRGMRDDLLRRIDREIAAHRAGGRGHLIFKCNALVDPASIQALYRASQAGVKVDLQIRGICCLRPGIPGLSENITVTSIVGRFLEHARIYSFRNGGRHEVLIGSADLMPRNLDGRVEVLVPVDDPGLCRALHHDILGVHLADNRQARRLRGDGVYERLRPAAGEDPVDAQAVMLEHRGTWGD